MHSRFRFSIFRHSGLKFPKNVQGLFPGEGNLFAGHMAKHVIKWENLAPSSKVRSLQLSDF